MAEGRRAGQEQWSSLLASSAWGAHIARVSGLIIEDQAPGSQPIYGEPVKRRHQVVAVILSGAVALGALAAGPGPSEAAKPAPAAGIGDDYFPLDGNRGIDVRRYVIDDHYQMSSRFLQGSTTLTVKATARLSSFNLDLLLTPTAVTIDGSPVGFASSFHEVKITPAAPIAKGKVFTVDVAYQGYPGTKSYAGESNWLADGTEVVAMNQPHMAPWWFASNDHPRDAARMDISITTDSDQTVIANGRQVSRTVVGDQATTRWVADEPMATYLAFFAAGDFWTDHGRRDKIDWLVAVSNQLPANQRTVLRAQLRRTPVLVQWLEGKLGRYPFTVTGGLVTSLDVGFALENQTRPTYPSMWLDDTLMVHELAHQWFGDSVRLHDWRDIWLNEGWASYLEWTWSGQQGTDPQQRLRNIYQQTGAASWRTRTGDPGPAHIFDDFAVYDRGAMTLQALRNRIGSHDFWRLAKGWAHHRAGRTGTTAQFITMAERISGEKLDGFFRAWLYSSTKPSNTRANGLGF